MLKSNFYMAICKPALETGMRTFRLISKILINGHSSAPIRTKNLSCLCVIDFDVGKPDVRQANI